MMWRRSNQLPWGLSLIIVGIIFLLKQLDVFSPAVETFIFNWRNLLFLFGLIFLFTHRNRTIGVVLLLIWSFVYLKDILLLTKELSELIWPLLLIVAGVYLVVQSPRIKKEDNQSVKQNSSENNETDDAVDN